MGQHAFGGGTAADAATSPILARDQRPRATQHGPDQDEPGPRHIASMAHAESADQNLIPMPRDEAPTAIEDNCLRPVLRWRATRIAPAVMPVTPNASATTPPTSVL